MVKKVNTKKFDNDAFVDRIEILINEHCDGNRAEFNRIVGQARAEYRWRTEKRFPKAETLIRIVNYFGVSMDWLLGFVDAEDKTTLTEERAPMPDLDGLEESPQEVAELKRLLKYYREVADHYRDLYEHARTMMRPLKSDPQPGAAEQTQP